MSVGTHYGPAVRGVATRIETNLSTFIATVAAEQSVKLKNPVRYSRDRRQVQAELAGTMHGRRPVVFIVVEGSVGNEPWITPQTDKPVPLLVRIVYDDPRQNGAIEDVGDAYAEAIERCLDTHVVDAATGIWWWVMEDTTPTLYGEGVWTRAIDVRGEFKVRTNRSE